jgi:hypothetical protein
MNYTRNDNANPSGTSLQLYQDGLTLEVVTAAFGKPMNGVELEKGYNHELVFEGDDGSIVTLYDRWHNWRIGATTPEAAERFKGWLATKLPNA